MNVLTPLDGYLPRARPAGKPLLIPPGAASSTSPETLQVEGITVVVKPSRGRHCWVRVLPPLGQVEVRVPTGMSREQARKAVLQQRNWITKAQQRMRHQASPALPARLANQSILWGQTLQVQREENPQLRRVQIQHDGLWLVLKHPPQSTLEQQNHALQRWQDRQLLEVAQRLLQHWQPVVGREVSALTVRSMRTRWGSCTPSTGRVRLNRELVRYPQELLEYVLVHELTHLHEPDHGPQFRTRMDTYLPQWRSRRSALRKASLVAEFS